MLHLFNIVVAKEQLTKLEIKGLLQSSFEQQSAAL
jgi:hypothetical protein